MNQQQQEQDYPPTEQPDPQHVTQRSGDVGMRKAAAKEDFVYLTSGAKEKMGKTLAGMKGVAHIITHPFSKDAKEEAIVKTAQQKQEIADKQERIRATAHLQLVEEKAAADGVDLGAGSGSEFSSSPSVGAQQLENVEARSDSVLPDQGPSQGSDAQQQLESDKSSEDSFDGPSRGRARALAQIPPDS